MRNPAKFYKIASWLIVIIGMLHTSFDLYGQIVNKKMIAQTVVFQEMRAYEIELLGSHTLYEFYSGFSLAMGFLLIVYGVLNLLIINQVFIEKVKHIIKFNIAVCTVMLLISGFYFHLLAVIVFALAIVSFFISYKQRIVKL